jgi:hypothetical protein
MMLKEEGRRKKDLCKKCSKAAAFVAVIHVGEAIPQGITATSELFLRKS